jgi:hypothetical protein
MVEPFDNKLFERYGDIDEIMWYIELLAYEGGIGPATSPFVRIARDRYLHRYSKDIPASFLEEISRDTAVNAAAH